MRIAFFASPAALREWLEEHHLVARELWVGFYKKDSGKPSITWPESVDEALCFGWIDGVRKRVDETSYVIRFTPRKATSTWSAVNIERIGVLEARGRLRPAGRKAFEARQETKSRIYSYEQRRAELGEPYEGLLKKNKAAWKFFQARSPGYRKRASWWVTSARTEETRRRRIAKLIAESERGRTL